MGANRRAAVEFEATCNHLNKGHVCIVGGSPSQRVELRKLFKGRSLMLRLVDGQKRRTLAKAKADQRGCDFVVVWGRTELKHSNSGLYQPCRGIVLVVAKRGLGTMLSIAGDKLARVVAR